MIEPYYQTELGKLYCGDCLDILPTTPAASVDLVVTDPPYFLPATHYNTRKQFSRNFSDLGILEHFYKDFFRELSRIVKPQGTLYVFCDGQSYPLFYYHLYPYCKTVRPLIWNKKTSINGYSWRHQHEIIIFAEMPEAKPIPSGDGDIIEYSAVEIEKRKHPAEKPVDLIRCLINKSVNPYSVVCDPFIGSGTVGVVCQQLKTNWWGIEIGREYCDVAISRLKGEGGQVRLDTGQSDGRSDLS